MLLYIDSIFGSTFYNATVATVRGRDFFMTSQ